MSLQFSSNLDRKMVNLGKSMQISTISCSLFGQQINQMRSLHSKQSKPTKKCRSPCLAITLSTRFRCIFQEPHEIWLDDSNLSKWVGSSEEFSGWIWNISFENTEPHIALKRIPSFAKWYCIFTWCYKQLKYWRRLHELDFKYSTHLTSWTIFLGGLKQLKNHLYDVYTHFLGVKNTMWVSESLWVVAIATLNIASGSCTG